MVLGDTKSMFFKNYILANLRLMVNRWWLSLIKVFSLTSGILSLLLIWFFYVDNNYFGNRSFNQLNACSIDTLLLLGSVLFTMMLIYFLIIRSQISFRYKEFFIRRYYGESSKGIIFIMMSETIIFISLSFMISLVLMDQVTPFFNLMTNKSIDLQAFFYFTDIMIIVSFLSALFIVLGLLPALWNARKEAVDFLQKLPR